MIHSHRPLLTALIGCNIAIFLLQQNGYDLRPIAALWLPSTPLHHSWQWISHLFMHADLPHLVFNMYAIGMFAPPLIQIWGVKRFLLLYFAAGVVGSAAYCAWMLAVLPPEQWPYVSLLGASGAAFGVLAAFAVLLPRAPLALMFLPWSFPAKYFVSALVAYEIFAQLSGISLFGPNIAHLAHIGGALTGAALAAYWRKTFRQ